MKHVDPRLGNLRPVQPGQVLNPQGRNQYNYRREAEQVLDALLREVVAGRTRAAVMIDRVLQEAEKGPCRAAVSAAYGAESDSRSGATPPCHPLR